MQDAVEVREGGEGRMPTTLLSNLAEVM